VHYYKKQIGHYNNKAARLSILQHGVYNLLIDSCYDRERFPTRKEAIEWIWVSTPEEEQALDFVLKRFFCENKKKQYVQDRIAEELEKYHARCATNKANRNKNTTNGDDSSVIDNETTTSKTQLRIKNKELRITGTIYLEQLWEHFNYGAKGSKKKALSVFDKLNLSNDLFNKILIAAREQAEQKSKAILAGEFTPNFPHVERWLRDERWNDDIREEIEVEYI
tara:strand:- start:1699 stop:2367 length:669 start_codon:yes stop_codon:yes gene_type:complete